MNFFECYPDEVLLKQLGLKHKELKSGHSHGRSRVCGKLARSKNSFGLIDEDPASAKDPYLSRLLGLKPIYVDQGIILIHEKESGNKLAIIRPNLEEWVVRIAKDKKIELDKTYSLPKQPSKLHDSFAPKDNVNERRKLGNFIKKVSDHKSIVRLREFLK